VTRPHAVDAAPRSFETIADALAALAGARVLDVRDEDAFARGHVEGAGRVSPGEFGVRRFELPSRETPVLVVHDSPARARSRRRDRAPGRARWRSGDRPRGAPGTR